MRSAIVIISSPCLRANFFSSGTRAIVPSSFITSQITPAGGRPAIRARSTAASVCPARTSVPPDRDLNGNTCPGRMRSRGVVAGSSAARIVLARSAAEIPVDVPARASMDTQNAVSRGEELSETSSGMSSSSSRSGVIARQTRPRPYLAMKFTASGVTFDAAIVRSPSFSRSSSSTTTIIRPSRTALMASSIGANVVFFLAPLASFNVGFVMRFLRSPPRLSRAPLSASAAPRTCRSRRLRCSPRRPRARTSTPCVQR